jgi:integrase
VAAFLTDWLPTLEVRGLRASTRASYKIMIDTQIVPRIGSVQLQKLSAAHLNAMYAEMLASGRIQREGGLSARTVRYAHTIIRKALSDAVKWNLLVRNPGDAADPPSAKAAKAREMKTWSPEELGRFLREVAEDRLFAAVRLVAMTGMRRGEVLGLRWRDVDLVTGRAAITQTIIAPRYVTQLSTPKTDKGRRSVELDAGTVDVLRAHKKRQAEERLAFGPGYEDNDLAFCREDGSPLKPHLFSMAFETGEASGPTEDPPARPQAHSRDPRIEGRRAREGRVRATGPFKRRHHARHLLARRPRTAERVGRPAGRDGGR